MWTQTQQPQRLDLSDVDFLSACRLLKMGTFCLSLSYPNCRTVCAFGGEEISGGCAITSVLKSSESSSAFSLSCFLGLSMGDLKVARVHNMEMHHPLTPQLKAIEVSKWSLGKLGCGECFLAHWWRNSA